jgi:hypothetical protein
MAKSNKNKPKPSPQPQEGNFRWFFGNVFGLVRKHGNLVIIWIGIGWCAREFAIAAMAFAGKQSVANWSLSVLANIQVVWAVSITLSGVSIGLYFKERKKHRETRERLTARVKELELTIDPNRTSSHLTPEGLTRREDE